MEAPDRQADAGAWAWGAKRAKVRTSLTRNIGAPKPLASRGVPHMCSWLDGEVTPVPASPALGASGAADFTTKNTKKTTKDAGVHPESVRALIG